MLIPDGPYQPGPAGQTNSLNGTDATCRLLLRAGCCSAGVDGYRQVQRGPLDIRLTVRAGLVSACRQPVRAEPPAPCTISHSAAEPVDDSPGTPTPEAGGFLAVSAPARPSEPG